ncbi:TetR/AcrR family transcriptional regulator [Amycolatopsis sp. K13G38]|uniref:TetR/AcrR family transcriptional regulator n=2 Tax=Amycolatopsis acididurans TaxID=2724524 RepID=A0ABX1JG32_9PSEU|nr:TetR/AcrR family transcriptional regulator [Amycolatopsis acididurans]
MREQVLKTAHALTVDKGWDRVRLSEIAEVVGVSRPTIYKEFGDKTGLGDAMIVAEAERFLAGIAVALDEHAQDAPAAILAAVRYTLDEAERSPLLKAVLTSNRDGSETPASGDDGTRPGGGAGMLPLLTTSHSMLHTASASLTAWFAHHFPELDAVDIADGVDALVRLTVSHLVLPEDSRDATARRITLVALRYLRLDDLPSARR